jgi:hypothetical protein
MVRATDVILIPSCTVATVTLMSDRVPGDLAALAYELSLRSLQQQEGVMNEIRARTGTLIAAASIVTSFVGGAAIARHGLGILGTFGLASFAVAIALATWVLLPKPKLVFAVRGHSPYETEIEADVFDIAETHRRLAYWLDEFHTTNAAKIERLLVYYRLASGALLLEAVLWSVHLGVH